MVVAVEGAVAAAVVGAAEAAAASAVAATTAVALVGLRCQNTTSTSTARSTCGDSPSLTGRWPLVVVVASVGGIRYRLETGSAKAVRSTCGPILPAKGD